MATNRGRRNRAAVTAGVRYAIIFALLALWEYNTRIGVLNPFYTSYPSAILADLYEFTMSGELAHHASITIGEALSGLFFGTAFGVGFGVLFSQIKFLGSVITPILTAIAGIPQLTLSPLYILWFGFGFKSKVILAGMMVFFGVFGSTYNAIKNLDQRWIEASSLLGANAFQTLTLVVIPACAPWIISSIRSGIGSCMVGAIMGEYIGASGGFGWMISFAASYFDLDRVLACVLILLVFNRTLNWVLDRLEGRILHWRTESNLSLKTAAD
ncbi:ABC transporter permease [Merdimmobilis hominis]|uniref:Aliphatic sulfonates transport permease protein SsuC n=1 Tax=uncultured Anaerotruncus sp. TaxID=905011 RepID=A0A6N2TAE3_9FIRM|nr:ABC transporter permease [Merdimmobilis hominis]MCD4835882.1 ABC transporter permease [Merdimmobilis hominis]